MRSPVLVSKCTILCKMKVLICDDDDFNLMTLKAMLEDLDIPTVDFLSGAQAV